MSDKIEFTQQSFDGESLIFDEGDKGDRANTRQGGILHTSEYSSAREDPPND